MGSSTYERIKQAIVDGDIAEGDSLVETVLARRFEVSRTPIREALSRLEHDGLLERNSRGLEVRRRSPEEILDIYETRLVLEAKAAAVAAERRSDINLVQLRQLVETSRTLEAASPDEMAASNKQFHRAVWKAGRNESLISALERLSLHLLRYPRTTLSFDGRWERALDQHAELVEAIADRDPDRAAATAAAHFQEARDIRLKLWQEELA